MTPWSHAGKHCCLLPARLHLQLAADAVQEPGADLLVPTEKHHSICCQTCSCHGGHGVLHRSDLTCQSGGFWDTPAEHAVLLEAPGEHDGAPAEHAVHDAPPAGRPGAF